MSEPEQQKNALELYAENVHRFITDTIQNKKATPPAFTEKEREEVQSCISIQLKDFTNEAIKDKDITTGKYFEKLRHIEDRIKLAYTIKMGLSTRADLLFAKLITGLPKDN